MAETYIIIFILVLSVNIVSGNVKSEDKNAVIDKTALRSAFDTKLYEDVLDPRQCNEQLVFLSNHSLLLQFLDASGKIPSGIVTGNINDLGDYHQCLSINQVVSEMEIQGKYCMVAIPFGQKYESPGLSNYLTRPEIPRPDKENDVEDMRKLYMAYDQLQQAGHIITGTNGPHNLRSMPSMTLLLRVAMCIPKVCSSKQAIDFIQNRFFMNLTTTELFCRLPNDKPFTVADYVAFAIFGTILLVTALSTAFDLYFTKILQTKCNRPLYRIFSVYTNTKHFLTFNTYPGALECVDGIGAISMMWIIVSHTYMFTLTSYVHNIYDVLAWLGQFSSIWFNSAPISVDTFFLLSGILCVYATIGKITRIRFAQSIHLFYLNRLLRMFPLLAAVVLLEASVFNHVSDGPNWQNVAAAVNSCRKNCRASNTQDYMTTYYVNTLTRAPPFFVGMAYGYLLHLWRDKQIRISKVYIAVLWVSSFIMMAFRIFSIYPIMQVEAQLLDNILNAYMRAIWALALGWLILACVKGYGGPINWFLSLNMWKLPARLSYAMYLLHLSIIIIANGSWVKTHYFTSGETLYRFGSDISYTFIGAFILCILIDSPFSTIQKLLLRKGKRTPVKAESQENIIENGVCSGGCN